MAARANATIVWKADAWKAAAMPAINAGLYAAATVMADQAVVNMGSEGGGVVGASKSPLAGGPMRGRIKIRGRAQYESAPPGAYPGVRTSNLRNSIRAVHPDALGTPGRAAFGTAVPYGRHLEFGTRYMAARPWIVRSAMMARPAAMAAFRQEAFKRLKAGGLTL